MLKTIVISLYYLDYPISSKTEKVFTRTINTTLSVDEILSIFSEHNEGFNSTVIYGSNISFIDFTFHFDVDETIIERIKELPSSDEEPEDKSPELAVIKISREINEDRIVRTSKDELFYIHNRFEHGSGSYSEILAEIDVVVTNLQYLANTAKLIATMLGICFTIKSVLQRKKEDAEYCTLQIKKFKKNFSNCVNLPPNKLQITDISKAKNKEITVNIRTVNNEVYRIRTLSSGKILSYKLIS